MELEMSGRGLLVCRTFEVGANRGALPLAMSDYLRPWKWARWQRSDLHVGVSDRRPRSHPQVAVTPLFTAF